MIRRRPVARFSPTLYATCSGGVRAVSVGSGSPPALAMRPGSSAASGASGPTMIAGGLPWARTEAARWSLRATPDPALAGSDVALTA
jgi:hypothetical protein